MKVLANLLVAFVAIQHIGFMLLEMFFWTKPIGQKVFKITPEFAVQTQALAANQGLYNGFLVAGLIWSLLHSNPSMSFQLKIFFLCCVVVAGIYGAMTVSKGILFVQALPALLALIICVMAFKK
ncbi:MAG: hypothetical protein CME62_10845 [Halobacteriovoraceae bacterium]|nr:hypothetical protein [Halobacteriovoraceae bacterium]